MNEQHPDILQQFKHDHAIQSAYLDNLSRFLEEDVTPHEYALEVQALEAGLSKKCTAALNKAMLEPGLTARPMLDTRLNALPGGAQVRLEPTYGKLSVLTGYYLILNEKATADIIAGATTGAALAGLIAGADPELLSKSTAAVIAGALLLEVLALKVMDGGKGVYFYMNPFLFSTIPVLGPAGLVAAWVGPLSN